MTLFKENIALQQQIEQEATYIGKDPITPQEARLIRYLRGVKEITKRKKVT